MCVIWWTDFRTCWHLEEEWEELHWSISNFYLFPKNTCTVKPNRSWTSWFRDWNTWYRSFKRWRPLMPIICQRFTRIWSSRDLTQVNLRSVSDSYIFVCFDRWRIFSYNIVRFNQNRSQFNLSQFPTGSRAAKSWIAKKWIDLWVNHKVNLIKFIPIVSFFNPFFILNSNELNERQWLTVITELITLIIHYNRHHNVMHKLICLLQQFKAN